MEKQDRADERQADKKERDAEENRREAIREGIRKAERKEAANIRKKTKRSHKILPRKQTPNALTKPTNPFNPLSIPISFKYFDCSQRKVINITSYHYKVFAIC